MHSSTAYHIHQLALHAMATLPDSIRERKQLLPHVVGALPRNDDTRLSAQAMLKVIQQQDLLQREFAHDHSRADAVGPGGHALWRPHRCARTGPFHQPS